MSSQPPEGPNYGSSSPQSPGGDGYFDKYSDGPSSPPPPPPYGAPGGYSGGPDAPWAVGDALAYGWRKFQQNVAQILLAALFVLLAALAAGAVSSQFTSDSSFIRTQIGAAIGQFLINLATMVISAAILRGALDVTEGRRFEFFSTFSRINVVNVILNALLVSLITAVGILLCILPGIVAWFLLLFAPFFVVDKNMGPVEAIKASIKFTCDNLSDMIVWILVGGIIYVIGFCLCGVGALVTVPVVLIGAAFTYKKLSGEPVAP